MSELYSCSACCSETTNEPQSLCDSCEKDDREAVASRLNQLRTRIADEAADEIERLNKELSDALWGNVSLCKEINNKDEQISLRDEALTRLEAEFDATCNAEELRQVREDNHWLQAEVDRLKMEAVLEADGCCDLEKIGLRTRISNLEAAEAERDDCKLLWHSWQNVANEAEEKVDRLQAEVAMLKELIRLAEIGASFRTTRIAELEQEVARLKEDRYPRTCWDGHDEIGHRLELGECPLCKSMIAHDQRSIQLAASEADNDQLRTRIAELEAGLREIRDDKTMWKAGAGGQDQFAGLPPMIRLIHELLGGEGKP